MAVIKNSVLLSCQPEAAFDYLVDLANEAEWNPEMERVEKITPGPIGVGTRWSAKWRATPKPVTVELIEVERPKRWVGHNGGLLEVTLTGRLEPEAGGVRLNIDFDVRPHGPLRLFFPLILRKLRRGEANNMEYIRKAVEGREPETR